MKKGIYLQYKKTAGAYVLFYTTGLEDLTVEGTSVNL